MLIRIKPKKILYVMVLISSLLLILNLFGYNTWDMFWGDNTTGNGFISTLSIILYISLFLCYMPLGTYYQDYLITKKELKKSIIISSWVCDEAEAKNFQQKSDSSNYNSNNRFIFIAFLFVLLSWFFIYSIGFEMDVFNIVFIFFIFVLFLIYVIMEYGWLIFSEKKIDKYDCKIFDKGIMINNDFFSFNRTDTNIFQSVIYDINTTPKQLKFYFNNPVYLNGTSLSRGNEVLSGIISQVPSNLGITDSLCMPVPRKNEKDIEMILKKINEYTGKSVTIVPINDKPQTYRINN